METSQYFRILSLLLIISLTGGNGHTTANLSPQPLPNNQLTPGDQIKSNTEQETAPVGQLVYRSNIPGPGPTYVSNYQPSFRDSASAPFFGLASNGEFQLSAYFSQIFWGFVGLVVAVAVIIWLVRVVYPHESIGGLVEKIKTGKAGKSLDLDRVTNMVYGALDSYAKWASKATRDPQGFYSNSKQH